MSAMRWLRDVGIPVVVVWLALFLHPFANAEEHFRRVEVADIGQKAQNPVHSSQVVLSIGILGPHHAFEYRTAARATWLQTLLNNPQSSLTMRPQVVYRFVVPQLGGSWSSSASLDLENSTYGDIVSVPCDNMAELPLKWLEMSVHLSSAFFHAVISVNSYVLLDKMLARLVALPRDNVFLARLQHTTACYFSTCKTSQPLAASSSSCSCMRVYKGWDTEAPVGPELGAAPDIQYQPDTLLPVEIEGDEKRGRAFSGAREHERVCQLNKGVFGRPFWAPLSPAMVVSANVITSLFSVPAPLCQFVRYGPGPAVTAGEAAGDRRRVSGVGMGADGNVDGRHSAYFSSSSSASSSSSVELPAKQLSHLALMAGMADTAYLLHTLAMHVSMVSSKDIMTLGRDMELIEDVYRLESAVLVQRLHNSTTMRLLHKLLGPGREPEGEQDQHGGVAHSTISHGANGVTRATNGARGTNQNSISIMLQLQTKVGARHAGGSGIAAERLSASLEHGSHWIGVGVGTQPVKGPKRYRLGVTVLVCLAVFHVVVVVGLWVYVHRTMISASKKYDQRHVNMMYAAMWGGNATPQSAASSRKGLLGRY